MAGNDLPDIPVYIIFLPAFKNLPGKLEVVKAGYY